MAGSDSGFPPCPNEATVDDEVSLPMVRPDELLDAFLPLWSPTPQMKWEIDPIEHIPRHHSESKLRLERRQLSLQQQIDRLDGQEGAETDTFEVQAVAAPATTTAQQQREAFLRVVAEYAVALAHKHLTRAVYTSPIKTLSNQKFRDFRDTFGKENVGLLTGDTQINGDDASCLVMTTEILRSMLYRGADVIRDVEFVVFDEVHYVNDPERGVVWEEVIIMLPDHVKLVMLSATVPNVKEFAEWVGRVRQRRVYVLATMHRPVPLRHFLWTGAGAPIMFQDGTRFDTPQVDQARRALLQQRDKKRGAKKPTKGSNGSNGERQIRRCKWRPLLAHAGKQEKLPLVIFLFSKKQVERDAKACATAHDYSDQSTRQTLHNLWEMAMKRLHGDDRELPQLRDVRALLERGVGVHHGGLLPIVKETVELAFAQSVVKVLFATETFAMGVNVAVRTVVFGALAKHDGKGRRSLLPGEYTQMAGRAGRRGLDEFGDVVVACLDEVPEAGSLKQITRGQAQMLESRFRLTWHMTLHWLRSNQVTAAAELIRRSFGELRHARRRPELRRQLTRVCEARETLLQRDPSLTHYVDYAAAHARLRKCETELVRWLLSMSGDRSNRQAPLQEGTLVETRLVPRCVTVPRATGHMDGDMDGDMDGNTDTDTDGDTDTCVDEYLSIRGVVVGVRNERLTVLSVLPSSPDFAEQRQRLRELQETRQRLRNVRGVWQARSLSEEILVTWGDFAASEVHAVLAEQVRLVDVDTLQRKRLGASHDVLRDNVDLLLQYQGESLPPFQGRGQQRKHQLLQQVQHARQQLPPLPLDLTPVQRADVLAKTACLLKLKHAAESLHESLSDDNVDLIAEFENRTHLLSELGYLDQHSAVLTKGRVACEISTCDAVVVTELLFGNILADLTAAECAALLSCLVFQPSRVDPPDWEEAGDNLENAYESLKAIAENLAHKMLEYDIEVSPEAFVEETVKPGLVTVTKRWAEGKSFSESLTAAVPGQVQEGTVVRTIVRLDETCRGVRNAARVLGDFELARKLDHASALIKRDIVFAASLYVS
ncbi:MAG: hypothetical protein MHM6MM_000948 [Cercozoa sp. M6MM]